MAVDVPSTWDLFKQLDNADLQPLVDYIKKSSTTELLTVKAKYKAHQPDHVMYISEIYDEICLFGGNTFVNLFRGNGPSYSEVLKDAASKVGAKDVKDLSILATEQRMLEVLLRKAAKEATGKDKEELERQLYEAGLAERDYSAFISGTALAGLLAPALYRVVMQQVSVVIANAVAKQVLGHGLRLGAGAGMGRLGAALLGPVGWAIAGIWTAIDIAGPAYRVTIPCTLHVAMLRQKWLAKQEVSEIEGAFDD